MSGERQVEPSSRRTAQDTPRTSESLSEYISTLRSDAEIGALICALDELASGRQASATEPGVLEMARRTGLDLSSPEDLRRAILALGKHAERLFEGRGPGTPQLEQRTLPALASGLVHVFEATRQGADSAETLAEEVPHFTRRALEIWQRNDPPRGEEEARWWSEVRAAVEARAVPAYLNAAERLARVEALPLAGLLFRSQLAMAVLCGLLGLLTFAMPVSTPLVCLGLALFGAYVAHPWYVGQVVEPLEALVENLGGEAGRIERLSGLKPWSEEHFTLSGALGDLLPLLEGERRAGRRSAAELRAAIGAYFDSVEPAWTAAGRGGHYLEKVRRVCEGALAQLYAEHAAARDRWERGLLASLLDQPMVTAVALAILTLPLSAVISRASPIPPSIDFPLMVLVFGLLGNALPRLLPGTIPSRDRLLGRVVGLQSMLESTP